MKRILALIVVGSALAVAGCGGVGHYAGGVAAHHVVNHLAPGHKRLANKVFCLYHGHRVLVDLHHHHLLAAGLNAVSAYRSCKAGFFHHH